LVDFRNTLFLLRDLLKEDILGVRLLDLYLGNCLKIKNQLESGSPPVIFWVGVIEEYLISKSDKRIRPEVYDVFAYEATKAMLQARYALWQLIDPEQPPSARDHFSAARYCPDWSFPVWQILSTTYKLSSVLPSENGWKKLRFRKGIYFYLLIAISEKQCKLLKINSVEFSLLKNISESLSFKKESDANYTEENTGSETFRRKMKRLGIF
jgi:hypothetical protein